MVYKKIDKLDISILVNNLGYCEAGAFTELSTKSAHDMMARNCYAIAILTKLILASFRKRKGSKSLVINHISASSLVPYPMLSLFSAT